MKAPTKAKEEHNEWKQTTASRFNRNSINGSLSFNVSERENVMMIKGLKLRNLKRSTKAVVTNDLNKTSG